jgi:Rieske Fe-S protein
MHLGCPVRYVQAAQRFICPCHGGVYGPLGQVDGGPPVRPLDRFYTRVVNGRVEVGARYSLDSHFKRFPHPRDPSNHLDGLWQYLYPSRPTT